MSQTNGNGDTPWSFGLGRYRWIANASAMGVMVLSFIWLGREFVNQAHNDRVMFREEMVRLHQSSERQWESIRATREALLDSQYIITENRKVLADLVRNVRELTEEVRKLKVAGKGDLELVP